MLKPMIRSSWKKGSIVTAYHTAVPGTQVICVDELGPLPIKGYPGEVWQPGYLSV